MTDAGSILFPSITICKDEMFDSVRYSERGLITRLQSGEVSPEIARSWFLNRTFSRAHLVKFLSVKTVVGSDNNNYPCDAVSGPKAGDPCSFPFIYPDCKLLKKVTRCQLNPNYAPGEYTGCYDAEDTDTPWCYTRTHYNRSHVGGEWGYCSHNCSSLTARSSVSTVLFTPIGPAPTRLGSHFTVKDNSWHPMHCNAGISFQSFGCLERLSWS